MSSRCRSRRVLGFVAAIPPRTLSQTGTNDPKTEAKTNTAAKTNTRTGRKSGKKFKQNIEETSEHV